jgi:hypothetical protein
MQPRPHASRSGACSWRFFELAHTPTSELHRLFLRGERPDPEALAGWEYRGLNAPVWARLVGIRKFLKGFERRGGRIVGYNQAVRQNRDVDPWLPPARHLGRGAPRRFGHYAVEPVDATGRDNAYLHALLLDYGRGGNPVWDPTRGLRDYLVRARPGSDDLLIGRAFYALGPLRVPASFFLLERHRPVPPLAG